MAYGFSVFWLPLSRAVGIDAPAVCEATTLWQSLVTSRCDWTVSLLGWTYTLFFVLLGSSAALFGRWLETEGPRKAGFVAAIAWSGGSHSVMACTFTCSAAVVASLRFSVLGSLSSPV